MKIRPEDFRAQEGDEVNLEKSPTHVHWADESKMRYETLLQEHVPQPSVPQQLRYAPNRHALLPIFLAPHKQLAP